MKKKTNKKNKHIRDAKGWVKEDMTGSDADAHRLMGLPSLSNWKKNIWPEEEEEFCDVFSAFLFWIVSLILNHSRRRKTTKVKW